MRAHSFAAMMLAGSLACCEAAAAPSNAVFANADGSLAGNVVLAVTVNGRTVDFGNAASGNYDQNGGQLVGDEFYFAGLYGSSDELGGDDLVHRDYFTFDVSGLGGIATAATLMIYNPAATVDPFSDAPVQPGYISGQPSLSFALYEVDASIGALLNSSDAPGIFTDLASGPLLGGAVVTPAADGGFVDVSLDKRAIFEINQGGTFALGGSVAAPEPATLALLGLGAAAAAALRRRRR